MAELNQGIKYTVEADTSKAEGALKNVGAEGMKGFNPLTALTAGLTGNFGAMGQELSKLVPRFKGLGAAGAAAFGAVGAAVMGVVKFVKALKDLVKTAFNLGGASEELKSACRSMGALNESAKRFSQQMDEARERAAKTTKHFEETETALNRLTKAQNEFNRAQELALATSQEQKDAINAQFDAINAQNDASLKADIAANRRKELAAEEQRIIEEIAQAEKRRDEYLARGRKANKSGQASLESAAVNYWTDEPRRLWAWMTGKKTGNLNTEEQSQIATQAFNAYDDEVEKIDELNKKLEENRHQQKLANINNEADAIEEVARENREIIAENDRLIAAEAKESAKEVEDVQKSCAAEVHRLKLEQITAEKAAQTAANSEIAAAESRLAAAKGQVAQAWGWYRNKDSMKAQLEEEKANAAAEKQFEKDFDRLSFRRDWRTAKNLSVDQEATRRVALAREEEAAAQKAVLEAAEAARESADHLAAIEAAITEEE